MSRNEWVTVTDCPYAARILTQIYKKHVMKRSDFHNLGNGQTIKQALIFLETNGYLTIVDIRIPHITSEIRLTEKGERTARRFIDILEDRPETESGDGLCAATSAENIQDP